MSPPIWSKGNSAGRNQPTSEVSSPSGRGVPLDHRGIEDRYDVRRLVAVRIGHAVLGTAEDTEDLAQLDRDTGLLLGLSDGTVTRALIRFDRTADGGPVPRVDQADEEKASAVISRQDRRRGEQEEVMAHHVPEVANVR